MIVLNWLLRSMTCKAVSTVRIIFEKRAVVFVVEATYAKPGMHEHKPGLTASNNLWHFAPLKSCRIKFTWGESTSTPDPKKHTYWTNFTNCNLFLLTVQRRWRSFVTWTWGTVHSRCLSDRGRTLGAGCDLGSWCGGPDRSQGRPEGPRGCS